MNKEPGSQNKSSPGFDIPVFVYFVLLGSYPLLSFLWRRNYPFNAGEVIALLLVLLIFSLCMTLLSRSVRSGAMSALTMVVTVLVLLVQFNFRLEGFLALVVLLALAFWKLGSRLIKFGIPVLMAMILGAFVESSEKPGDFEKQYSVQNAESSLPPVIHIVLDGFIGTAGLPAIPASAVFKNQVASLFMDFGFNHYPRAYSRYPNTGDSLTTAFNFQHKGDLVFREEAEKRLDHILKSNRYFDNLADAGYAIRVYQTSHMDFCRSNFESTEKCWTYSHPNVHTIRDVPALSRRTLMLFKVITRQSRILSSATARYFDDPAIAVHDPLALATLEKDLLEAPYGKVFFAHLLIPHNPFVYLNDCSVNYEQDPELSMSMMLTMRDKDPAVVNHRTLRYFEQAECALLSMRKLFEKMKSEGVFENATIVLHGDHGSSVSRTFPNVLNIQTLDAEDLKAHYSTLFAIKHPDGEFAENPRPISLSLLLEAANLSTTNQVQDMDQFLANEFSVQSPATEEFVYIGNGISFSRIDVKLFDQNN